MLQEEKQNKVHYYCVLDFEGTCEEDNPKNYKHEIIEFPAVLVNVSTLEVVSAVLTVTLKHASKAPVSSDQLP